MTLGEPFCKTMGTTAWGSAFRRDLLAAQEHALPPVTHSKASPDTAYSICDI